MSETIPLLRVQRRLFTPDEANALLPELIPVVLGLAEGVERARQVTDLLEETSGVEDRWAVGQDLSEIQHANRRALEVLEEHGVELKGLDPALLDFPGLRDGQEVYLCWREGEDRITHWHPVHTGMRGRKPIEPDPPSIWEYWS